MKQLLLILFLASAAQACTSNKGVVAKYNLLSDTTRLRRDMVSIVKTKDARNSMNVAVLNQVADYIKKELMSVSDSVTEQPFRCEGDTFKNVICSINTDKKERIIIGAHYDVCGFQDGADDNASGLVGMLELARLLKKEKLDYRIDFVAYTLEEPPYFRSDYMGSFVHAKYLHDHQIPVKGMICLEMIGYFSDKPKSQTYPVGFLRWFYGSKGDYITVVQKYWNGAFGNTIKRLMQKQDLLPTKSFKGPASLPGVDLSDHRNYWKFGYSSVMITNTAFYRNGNYHEKTDQIKTIDFKRLALVVDELYLSLKQMK